MKTHDHKTLVLNKQYMPIDIIPSKRAFIIVHCKGNATALVYHDAYISLGDGRAMLKPSIIVSRTNFYRSYNRTAFNKELMFERDNHECVYCGDTDRSKLTVDHIVPVSKGGLTSWENCVTACFKCNNEKSDLDIAEWGRERPNPKRPHFLLMIKNNKGGIPKEWYPYLLF